MRRFDWSGFIGGTIGLLFWAALLWFAFGSSIQAFFTPLRYDDCYTQSIPYEEIEQGFTNPSNPDWEIIQKGEYGTKQICKPNKDGYDNKITVLKQPVDEITRYIYHPDLAPQYENSQPTAICNDGTYSYSQSRSGTCSWHHGVRQWLY